MSESQRAKAPSEFDSSAPSALIGEPGVYRRRASTQVALRVDLPDGDRELAAEVGQHLAQRAAEASAPLAPGALRLDSPRSRTFMVVGFSMLHCADN